MRKFYLFVLAALLVAMKISAQDFEYGGLKYSVIDATEKTVAVVGVGDAFGDVTIPGSVSYDGNDYSVTKIGKQAFSKDGLNSIILPEGLLEIEESAFSSCWGLQSLTIPASVNKIAPRIIEGCSDLKSLSVATGNKNYDSRDGINAIVETSSNKIVVGTGAVTTIPSSILGIGEYAFYNLSNLIYSFLPR